jgi:hypothetical protein
MQGLESAANSIEWENDDTINNKKWSFATTPGNWNYETT